MRRPLLLKLLLAGTITSWLAAALYLAEGATRLPPSFRSPAQATSAPASIFTPDSVTLRGWIHSPAAQGWNGRAVLLLHGVGDSHLGMTGLARMLAGRGYRVLTPDNRGHGASGGEVFSYGVLERQDVRLWIDWMEQNWRPSSIFGMGASMGALILLQSLPQEPRLRAVVADCPFSTFRTVAYYRIQRAAGPLFVPSVEPALWFARLRFGVDLTEASPLRAMQTSDTPVLLIHGEEDRNIPIEQSVELDAARAGRNCRLWRVPRAGHVACYRTDPGQYEQRVTEWFEAHGTPRETSQ